MISGQPSAVLNVVCDPRRQGCGLSTPVQLPFGTYGLPFTCPGCEDRTLISIHLPRSRAARLPQPTKVHAFGDESKHDNVIAYGLVVIQAHDLLAAEQLLSGLKKRYGVDPNAVFHFADLAHGSKRQKSAWKHLTISRIMEFADELILSLLGLSTRFIIGAVHRSEYPEELPAVGQWRSGEMKEKQLAGVLCGAVLARLNEVYSQDHVKFWTDFDRTKKPFFGRTIQADSNYKLTNNDANKHIAPEPYNEKDKPALLQVADLFVYVAVHALTERKYKHKERYERLYKMCRPETAFLVYQDEIEIEPRSKLQARHAELIPE